MIGVGLVLMSLMLGVFGVSMVSGLLIMHWGCYWWVVLVVPLMIGVGYVLLATMGLGTLFVFVLAMTALIGIGMGFVL